MYKRQPVAQRQTALDKAVNQLDPAELYPYDRATARRTLAIEGCLNWPVAQQNPQPKMQRIIPRTLIVHGRNDLFCPVEWATDEARYAPRSKVVIVDDQGHGVQGSRTDSTGRDAVRDFLL